MIWARFSTERLEKVMDKFSLVQEMEQTAQED